MKQYEWGDIKVTRSGKILQYGEKETIWTDGDWSIVEQMGEFTTSFVLQQKGVGVFSSYSLRDIVEALNRNLDKKN